MSLTNNDDEFDRELDLVREKWENFDEVLQNIAFFKALGDQCIKKISENAEMKKYLEGEIIQHQNEISDSFYVVLQGEANCYSQSNGACIQMAKLKCGDFFGGKSLLNNSPNIVTVEAQDEVLCLVIKRKLSDTELRCTINQLKQAVHLYHLFENQF